MGKEHPDHHDADLVLKLYDLRRETVMREARQAIGAQFWPKSYDDVKAVLLPDHPLNAYFRQTASYWEMAYSFAKFGVMDPDFLIDSGAGEGIFLYAKVERFVEQIRKEYAPHMFVNMLFADQSWRREICATFPPWRYV